MRVTRRLCLAALVAGAVLCAPALSLDARQDLARESPELSAIVGEYLARAIAGSGGGLARGLSPDRIDGLSLARAREGAAWATSLLGKLQALKPETLSHEGFLTWSVLEFDLRIAAEADRLFWLTIPVTPYSSPLRGLTTPFSSFAFRTAADADTYLDALNQVPIVIAAYLAKLRSQVQRGIVLPAEELRLVVPFVRTFIGTPPQSAFSVAAARVEALPAESAAVVRQRVDETIRSTVNPALEALVAYIDGPYRARASASVGLGQYPGGPEAYQHLVRQHTGLDLTPAQVHEIGLAEVAALDAKFDEVRRAAKFAGSLAQFRTYLKTDRRFFPKSADEIGATMMAAIRRIEPKMDTFFLRKPAAPYGVKRLDESLEQSMTYGYYQVPSAGDPMGYYRFNGSQPESRSLVMTPAIIYHELIPGHHFQIMLRREDARLSPYRRAQMHTAFTEGWGMYSSDLADEMGMYDDPYARAGWLAMDLFLSSRLVVDTGMNALGWSRDRAMAFMREHTLESDVQIDTETLRYSSDMPAQALAYKLGARKIHELRRQVETAQGATFDIRRFHAYLLDHGSMPLGVLDAHIACYLTERHRSR